MEMDRDSEVTDRRERAILHVTLDYGESSGDAGLPTFFDRL